MFVVSWGQVQLRVVGVLAALWGVAGCQAEAQPFGRSDTIALYVPRGEDLPPGAVERIEDTFGMEVSFRSGGYGAITVFLFDEGPAGSRGKPSPATTAPSRCGRSGTHRFLRTKSGTR